jgi:hypothetical protein
LPFRTNKYTRQINALSLRWRAVPNPDRGDVIEAAAGERIVAFARPGKPPGFPVFNGRFDAFRAGKHPGAFSIWQRFLKPGGVGIKA